MTNLEISNARKVLNDQEIDFANKLLGVIKEKIDFFDFEKNEILISPCTQLFHDGATKFLRSPINDCFELEDNHFKTEIEGKGIKVTLKMQYENDCETLGTTVEKIGFFHIIKTFDNNVEFYLKGAPKIFTNEKSNEFTFYKVMQWFMENFRSDSNKTTPLWIKSNLDGILNQQKRLLEKIKDNHDSKR